MRWSRRARGGSHGRYEHRPLSSQSNDQCRCRPTLSDPKQARSPEHRGEVTAAFISCIYALVGGAVLTSGLLDVRVSLTIAVSLVAVVLAATPLLGAGWQVRARPVRARARPAST